MLDRRLVPAAALAAGLALLVPALSSAPLLRPTAAAWVDDAVLAAPASAAEFFGCQQGPVVVTTEEAPPQAGTVTVLDIDAECAGADVTVRVFDVLQGGELGEFPLVSGFENPDHGWVAFGGSVERVSGIAQAGQWSLRSFNRSESFHGPSRDVTGLVEPGETYLTSVWVAHAGPNPEPFQFTLREVMPGGETQFRPMASGTVPPGQWTQLTGEITADPAALEQHVYVEATGNPTLEFLIDEVRGETAAVPPTGGWVTASGTVALPAPTLSTDVAFHPLEGVGAMPVEVMIDGHAVPATWDYEQPAVQVGCVVVRTGTLDPVPGAQCTSVTVTSTGGFGDVGQRVLQMQMSFTASGFQDDGSQEIVFTVDLSTVSSVPADFQWDGAGVSAGSFLPLAGYSCRDLPTFSARAPTWAAVNPAYLELREQGTTDPVCGPR